jgi:hypothetical protein
LALEKSRERKNMHRFGRRYESHYVSIFAHP